MKPQKKEKNLVSPSGGQTRHSSSDGDKLLASLEALIEASLVQQSRQRAKEFLTRLGDRLRDAGVETPRAVSTPYANT
ncbi:MAG: hypothetical protein ACTHKU_11845, partial [Verrucomicrobiota bacterium]